MEVCKPILAKTDVQTVSSALELALFMDGKARRDESASEMSVVELAPILPFEPKFAPASWDSRASKNSVGMPGKVPLTSSASSDSSHQK